MSPPDVRSDSEEFKALRHRYYKLGKAHRWEVLRRLNLLEDGGEPLDQGHEKQMLFGHVADYGLSYFEEWIQYHEWKSEQEAMEGGKDEG